MPSNRDNKGKGTKGSNYDDLSGAGKTGATGNQQNSDLASGPGDNAQRGDWGSRQSGGLDQGNQAQSDLGSGPGDNSRRGSQNRNRQSADLDRSRQSDNLQGDTLGGNMQSGGQGSRSSRRQLDQDDLDSDESLER
ncbi:hypothetical protein [Massilia rhizosphaerae]|uniref:hypothetical protein n=1 Tax=Massilia rhizosphaerae TaxID=2784389 RepID=UPI0018DE0474|nr:hypothetical protein [Massilia rhizosphaerae]